MLNDKYIELTHIRISSGEITHVYEKTHVIVV
jgi:desulfoferrodoxin (superoxide reductase-like protein)